MLWGIYFSVKNAYTFILPLCMGQFLFVFLSWLWSLGININRLVFPKIKLNNRLFKKAFYYVSFCSILFTIFFSIEASGLGNNLGKGILEDALALFGVLYVIAIWALLYLVYFIAKNIVAAEQKKIPELFEFIDIMFLLLVIYVGVWIVQPRINKIYSDLPNDS